MWRLAYRVLFCFVWLFLASVAGIVMALFRPRDPNIPSEIAQAYHRWPLRVLGIQWDRRGFEKMVRPSVIVGNHQHTLDVFVMATMVPPRTIAVGKKQVLWIPVFGPLFVMTGNLLIDRKNQERAFETLRRAAQKIREQQLSVWLFPEGTRQWGKGLGPFKKGAFHLAIEAQVPIQPVVSSSFARSLDLRRAQSARIRLEALEPIPTLGMTGADVDQLIATTWTRMKSAIDSLDRELTQS